MNWLEAMANAGSGGLIGILGSGISGWLKIKGIKAKAEIDMAMAKLQIDAKTVEMDSEDFRASQNMASGENASLVALAKMAETKWQKWALILLHIYKGQVRPTLAIGANLAAIIIYFQMPSEFQTIILQQIFTLAFAYGGWYIGTRSLDKRLFTES